MYLHQEAQLIYLAHPRTASVATATALRQVGFEKLEPPSDHHSGLWDEGSPVTEENRESWRVMTTVRNHWDAAVSWVFRKFSTRGGEPDRWDRAAFEFALDYSNRWVRSDRLWWLHADDADVLLRFETLEEDLGALLMSADLPSVAIPHHNVSEARRKRPYREFYTNDTREYVAQRFAGEIERLEYSYG